MEKESWRRNWLDAINGLTSFELHEDLEVKIAYKVSSRSFGDFVNFYFGDLLFGFNYDFYVDEISWITQKEFEAVKDWHIKLEYALFADGEYSKNNNIPNETKWPSILHNGILAKQKLLSIIPESEKKYLK